MSGLCCWVCGLPRASGLGGGASSALPSQLALPVPGILGMLCLFCGAWAEELPVGLVDIVQHTGCSNDPGDVGLSELKVGSEGT